MFRLLKLPYVALNHVFSVMDPSDQFFVTLHYPKLIKYFSKPIYPCGTLLKYTKEDKFCLYKETQKGEIFPLIRFYDFDVRKEQKQLWTFGNRKISLRFIYSEDIITAIYVPAFRDVLYAILLEHFALIFGAPAFQNVSVPPENFKYIPRIERIRKLEISDPNATVDAAELKEIVKKTETFPEIVDIQPTIFLFVPRHFLNFNCLVVSDLSTDLMNLYFPIFTGKHLIVRKSSLMNDDVLTFIKSWLNGAIGAEGSGDNLESLMVFDSEFDRDAVLGGVATLPFQLDRRAAKYPTTCKYHLPESNNDVYDCTNAVDVQRESDGKLASIKISRNQFFFFVWDN